MPQAFIPSLKRLLKIVMAFVVSVVKKLTKSITLITINAIIIPTILSCFVNTVMELAILIETGGDNGFKPVSLN